MNSNLNVKKKELIIDDISTVVAYYERCIYIYIYIMNTETKKKIGIFVLFTL